MIRLSYWNFDLVGLSCDRNLSFYQMLKILPVIREIVINTDLGLLVLCITMVAHNSPGVAGHLNWSKVINGKVFNFKVFDRGFSFHDFSWTKRHVTLAVGSRYLAKAEIFRLRTKPMFIGENKKKRKWIWDLSTKWAFNQLTPKHGLPLDFC